MYDISPHQLCLGCRAKYFVHMFASSRCLFCQVSTLLSSDWPIFGILTSDIQRLHESGLEQFKCRQRCGWCEASVGSRNQECNYCLDTRNTKAGMCFSTPFLCSAIIECKHIYHQFYHKTSSKHLQELSIFP